MNKLRINNDYKNWLVNIKSKIQSSQIKASIKVNTELINLYWEIGAMIAEKQEKAKWGSGLISQLAKDLKAEFPNVNGFSKSNLYSMKQFYSFYNQQNEIVHQVGGQLEFIEKNNLLLQIPWRHHTLILQKIKNIKEAVFYIKETITNNWSRSILEYQIEINLYNRQGKAITNFKNTLPAAESDLAQELLKDPYNFDFLTLTKEAKEKDLEMKLVKHISEFLLELGKGFAYMGRQFKLNVGTREFRTDLLFYHTKLRAYIIIELKMTQFEPEYAGKLSFYVTAINETLKTEFDNPTIGILLCKTKDNLVVDFTLKDVNKPIAVSGFSYTELPNNIKNELPTIEEFEKQFK